MIWLSQIKNQLRALIEPTFIGPIYRNVRDEYRFRRARFVRNPYGFMFTGHDAMCSGTYEAAEVSEVKNLLTSVDMFVDVGANIGYFSCIAASMGKRVISIEPLVGNLRYLYANILANNYVALIEVLPFGVSDKIGIANFYGGGTGASLQEGWGGVSKHFFTTIALSTLDTLLSCRLSNVRTLIKVDVEGVEYKVFSGAFHVLRSKPSPIWLVEITLAEHLGGSTNSKYLSTFDYFFDLGYHCRSVGTGRNIIRSEIQDYFNTGVMPAWAISGNYIFYNDFSYQL